MKNYFNFTLTGKKLLPIWFLFLAFFMVPYVSMVLKMINVQQGDNFPILFFPMYLVLIVITFVIAFYITKFTIENIALNDKSIQFNGSFGAFIGKILLGYFFSIITAGIYMAWFIRDIYGFFIDNSTYRSNAFTFQGKGSKLFVILLLSIYVPMILFVIVTSKFMMNGYEQIPSVFVFQQLVMIFIMIPYMYLVYKWMVNVDYKSFTISWHTNFWNSCGKIAIEVILSIITFGVYGPLAMLRLYKYFAERTIAESDEKKLGFGYDIDQANDFLFIWLQMLLIFITLGIYYPWAFCKIGKRILSKTYLIENSAD
jgi:uncharacterized membrane protein YjgN (DUF898 family)